MELAELSAEDQSLLKTDFGPELEKSAQERVQTVQEMYQHGHGVLALQIADDMDKYAEEEEKEEKEEEKEEKDEHEEKTAAECGAFIERGLYDGLVKLGSERHGDPLYYLMPFVEEKVAAAGRLAALKAFAKKHHEKAKAGVKHVGAKAKEKGGKAVEGVKKYHRSMYEDARAAVKPSSLAPSTRARAAGAAALRAAPYGAGVAGLGYMLGRKKKED